MFQFAIKANNYYINYPIKIGTQVFLTSSYFITFLLLYLFTLIKYVGRIFLLLNPFTFTLTFLLNHLIPTFSDTYLDLTLLILASILAFNFIRIFYLHFTSNSKFYNDQLQCSSALPSSLFFSPTQTHLTLILPVCSYSSLLLFLYFYFKFLCFSQGLIVFAHFRFIINIIKALRFSLFCTQFPLYLLFQHLLAFNFFSYCRCISLKTHNYCTHK